MSFNLSISQNVEAEFNSLFGRTSDSKYFNVVFDTDEKKNILSDFLSVVGLNSFIGITGSQYGFSMIGCTVLDAVNDEISSIDYSKMTKVKKGKVDAFAELLISVAE